MNDSLVLLIVRCVHKNVCCGIFVRGWVRPDFFVTQNPSGFPHILVVTCVACYIRLTVVNYISMNEIFQ